MLTLLVDGDNIAHALKLRGEAQVEEFLQRLELAASARDWEVTVVFDGPERYLRRDSGLLVVKYGKGRSADSLIERMAYDHPDRMRLVVVTQDRAVHNLVRGKGALVWDGRRLMEEMVSGGIQ